MSESYTSLFLVTYKKLGNNPNLNEVDYATPLARLRLSGNIIDYRFEKDRNHILHLHCIYECRKNPFIRKYIVKGFNFHITPVFDRTGATDYINKCNPQYKREVIYLLGAAFERKEKEAQRFWEKCKNRKTPQEKEEDYILEFVDEQMKRLQDDNVEVDVEFEKKQDQVE